MAKRKKRAKRRFDRTGAKRLATRPRTKKAQEGDRRSKALGGSRRLRTGFVDVVADPAADNLRKIDNIVVLLMENRSFDHMLGYLKLEGNRPDVDGLTPGLNNSDGQKDYFIHHLDHYDYLAAEFTLCDHWFSSVPGATWPNRLYAAAAGSLPSVCWIDPIFVNTAGTFAANDDHPPADIRHGQEFVLAVYHALAGNPEQWQKTLLVIVYDEHGGFYDHVAPPPAEDDKPTFRSYGVRVPAILISPWVAQSKVVSTVFDHTSIIKTILLRFCRKADGSIPDMGKRVTSANHLGYALTEARPSDIHEPNEFQRGLIKAAKRLPPKRQK